MANIAYTVYAKSLSDAIDIAIHTIQTFPPPAFTSHNVASFISAYQTFKKSVEHPAPQYQNVKSLNHVQTDVFTYFQEATGPAVDYFWRQIRRQKLPYKRVNKLGNLLKRNKIKSRQEYDFIVDVLVAYQQEGLLNAEEVEDLNRMIDEFESRKSSPR